MPSRRPSPARAFVRVVAIAVVCAAAGSCGLLDEEAGPEVLPSIVVDDDREDDADDAADAPDPRPAVDESFQSADCPFEPEVFLQIECGYLTVPESRRGSSDELVEVAVAVLRTPNPEPVEDPVVYLAGGPGGVSLAEHAQWLQPGTDWSDHPILADRDFILVDQRGTGFSTPSLRCAEVTEEPQECHDRLVDEGIALEAYSTPEIAADIADLRVAMGIDEWNLYGSSYGTRLALAILRDHPDGVRSVVLEGVYPPDVVPAYHDYLGNSLSALAELADACAGQSACARAYGDVLELLVDALELADADPASSYDSIDLLDLVTTSMYSMDGVADVPFALQLAADGDVDAAADVLQVGADGFRPNRIGRSVGDPTEDSAGLFHSIECREEHAFTDLDVVLEQAEGLIEWGFAPVLIDALVDSVVRPLTIVCPTWSSGVAFPTEHLAAASDVPTLLFSGRFDPITPSVWGDRAAASLSSSTHVVAPNLSHSLVIEDPCIDAITARFFADPMAPVDTRCVSSMTMRPFTLPS